MTIRLSSQIKLSSYQGFWFQGSSDFDADFDADFGAVGTIRLFTLLIYIINDLLYYNIYAFVSQNKDCII